VPGLCRRVVAVPELEPCAVVCAATGNVEAATGLRVHKAALLSPAPLLGAGPIAVPELDQGPVADGTASDVDTFVQNT
jgi:hypothetical protein